MADECKVCKSYEEIYWSEFRVLQFIERLSDNSGDSLALPIAFVKNVRENLGGSVIVKTPNGSEWVVELKSVGQGDLLLKGGWREFVKAHCLVKGDTVVFKYQGNSRFDVTMFDKKPGGEKVCSYFVRKESNPITFERGRASKVLIDENGSSDDDGDGYELVSSRRKKYIKTTNNGRRRLKKLPEEDSDYLVSSRKGKRVCTNARTSIRMDEQQPKRRVVTEVEMNRARERANRERKDDDEQVVTMRPSYVHPRYSLVLSAGWARRHEGLNKSQDVELRVNGKSWKAYFYYRSKSAGLCRGWKAFVVENRVEEGDACLFRVIPDSRDPITLEVRIFRVNDTRV